MPTPPSKPIIFISYAPADEPEKPADGEVKWLSFVTGHLRAAEEIGALEIWTEPLAPGADLGPEAQRKLRACDVFAPLVSTHSLAFGAVVGRQIAIIRERQSRGEGVALYPLVLTPTPETALDIENLRPPGGRPFSSYDAARARSANAGRSGRDRGNRGGRSGAEDKAADEIAATLAGLAGCAAAADRPAARSGVRDHRTRIAPGLADEASPPGHGRDCGAGGVARDGVSGSSGTESNGTQKTTPGSWLRQAQSFERPRWRESSPNIQLTPMSCALRRLSPPNTPPSHTSPTQATCPQHRCLRRCRR